MTTSTQTAKATALEGLDFIETEEDVKAVEAATLKIQSTFRGKKIRSKFGAAKTGDESDKRAEVASTKQVNKSAGQKERDSREQEEVKSKGRAEKEEEGAEQQRSCKPSSKHKRHSKADETHELSRRVGEMQVQDSSAEQPQVPGELAEEQAERAATKIQAGFKGYKTRKELEVGGKLASGGSAGARQAAPGAK